MNQMERMEQSFLTEYNSDAAIRKYSFDTAGRGINYLLENEYGPIYSKAVTGYMKSPLGDGLRLLEFGCGAGMNLIHAASTFQRHGTPIAAAYGADFSKALIEKAQHEALSMPSQLRTRTKFFVARNELLIDQLATGLGVAEGELHESFHLIIGVNTFRYSYRQKNAEVCAREIYQMLKPGGVCVNIDMNNKFPAFRTLLRDRVTRPKEEYYLPKLEEYTAPFASAGLEILESRHFCWIPHSAGRILLGVCKALTPALNTLVPSFAMRSLVISRKPI